MKVFDLGCPAGHGFEGWFGSEADYQHQQQRGLLTCPMCGSGQIERRPSAPRLNLSGAREPAPSRATPGGAVVPAASAGPRQGAPSPVTSAPDAAAQAALEAGYLQWVRRVMNETEDVGPRFTEEVRRIHYGETEHRNLRGETTPEQRQALHEEGIEVFSLPVPAALKGPVQ
jgi:hypothetical protein